VDQYDEWVGRWKSRKKSANRQESIESSANREETLHGSFKVVRLAMMANFTMFCTKGTAAVFTGSSTMFSEAIHSLADFLNEGLLAFGIHRSLKEPDPEHPYGFEAEKYAWALVSGVGIFFLGGGMSLYHGVLGFMHPHELGDTTIARAILGLSLCVDGSTMLVAYRQIKRTADAAKVNVWDYGAFDWTKTNYLVRRGADPTSVQVLLEDLASVLGVAIAFTCLTLAAWTGNNMYDALGSILIGCLLAVVAVFLVKRNVAGLTGTSLSPSKLNELVNQIKKDPAVISVHDVKSQSLGPEWSKFKAEINFNGGEITRRYLTRQQVEHGATAAAIAMATVAADKSFMAAELRKAKSLETEKDLEEFLARHGKGVVDQLGREVDRIENEMLKTHPKLRHVDLEIL
jgi:zinc transporter 9